MKFTAWLNKHPEIKDSQFIEDLQKDKKRYEALLKNDWPVEVWNNMIVPPSERFEEEQAIKAKLAQEKKEAKKAMKAKK